MNVRVVVVNWNSFALTDACLQSLRGTTYSRGQFDVVVVDNGSGDGSAEALEAAHPWVQFIRNTSNLGFAEACNQGMRYRYGVDAIALVNNDATVAADWLDHLVDSLELNPNAGAAAAMLVLDPDFATVELDLPEPMFISAARVDDLDTTGRVLARPSEQIGDPNWPIATRLLIDGRCTILVPASVEAKSLELDLEAADSSRGSRSIDLPRVVSNDPSGTSTDLHAVSPNAGHARSFRIRVVLDEQRAGLVNGLGTRLTPWGEAYDIGFGQMVDGFGAAGESTRVDGFCGGGVLLRSAALDDVGLFDPRLFAYYEDTDLSWRMRRSGWSIVTVPESRIRHRFGGSGGSKAPWFFFLNYRNWLLTVLRNGDRHDVSRALGQLREWLRGAVRGNIASRIKHGQVPSTRLIRSWLRVLVAVMVELPRLWLVRGRRIGLVSCRSVRSFLQPR